MRASGFAFEQLLTSLRFVYGNNDGRVTLHILATSSTPEPNSNGQGAHPIRGEATQPDQMNRGKGCQCAMRGGGGGEVKAAAVVIFLFYFIFFFVYSWSI